VPRPTLTVEHVPRPTLAVEHVPRPTLAVEHDVPNHLLQVGFLLG
jgi:hypothetical protein